MAASVTVSQIYDQVCWALMENYDNGSSPGLSLGVVTESDFFNFLGLVCEDFINRSGLVWQIFGQQLLFSQSQYQYPEDMNQPKVAFVGGQWVDHLNLFDLDNTVYQWRSQLDTPQYWHEDGLPPKTVEVAASPNYSGASYAIPVGPQYQPPFGVVGLFNGSTVGRFTGTATVTGTSVAWVSGALFDLNWNNYYPPPMFVINGVAWVIANVASNISLTLALAPGDGTINWSVTITNDGNLTILGTQGLSSITFTLGELIPVVPDSFTPALVYGVLARIFSQDGECKDLQRAAYANARYVEFLNCAAQVAGEMLEIS